MKPRRLRDGGIIPVNEGGLRDSEAPLSRGELGAASRSTSDLSPPSRLLLRLNSFDTNHLFTLQKEHHSPQKKKPEKSLYTGHQPALLTSLHPLFFLFFRPHAAACHRSSKCECACVHPSIRPSIHLHSELGLMPVSAVWV